MKRAIVFIHQGVQTYFKIVLEQAKFSNPSELIIVVGNKNIEKYPGIKYINIDSFSDSGKEFSKLYEHMSTNEKWFEMVCYRRWFILRDVMKLLSLDCIWVCDSDNMIYTTFDSVLPTQLFEVVMSIPFQPNSLTMEGIGHNSIWKYAGLEHFNSFIMSLYSPQHQHENVLRTKWQYICENELKGGISDMTALFLFAKKYNHINNMVYNKKLLSDNNINISTHMEKDEYEMQSGFKKLKMINDIPHLKSKLKEEDVAFSNLHFQGKAKFHIHKFYTGENSYWLLKRAKVLLQLEVMKQFIRKNILLREG